MKPVLRNVLIALALGLLVIIGIGAWLWSGNPTDRLVAASTGAQPQLVEPEAERFPTLGLAKPVGWQRGEAPVAPAGLQVNRFADRLNHPRTMLALPNGDVLVTETNRPPARGAGLTGWVMGLLFKQVGAGEPSPNRLVLLRDANGDGVAEQRHVLRTAGLASPSGLAYANGKLYVANHDAVLAFNYKLGDTAVSGAPTRIMPLPAGGNHWMRNLQLSGDGKLLYVAVGSASNIGEHGMASEKGRAMIWEVTLATGRSRPYGSGLRNPNGMDWNSATGELWTVVQERDQLGGDLVPDYLTNVPIGAQYGWPWVYWKDKEDDRVMEPMPDFLTEYTRKPEYALGAHTAALGLRFAAAGNRLGPLFTNGAFVARHGSWNRKPLSGYDIIFVTFDANGNPRGMPVTVLSGFLRDQRHARGRPTWLEFDKTGALLVSDDTAGIIWRVIDPKAAPSAAIKPVETESMPPQQELSDDPEAAYLRPEGFKDP
ncbi:MAG: PQQ-dependent sugar dehydrogenase [Pseudomonadota bacterium]